MPDIILPKRVPALLTRRRSVDAPTAADVPTINSAVARDPGLDVPRGAFGGDVIDSQVRRAAATRHRRCWNATNSPALLCCHDMQLPPGKEPGLPPL